MTLARHVTLRRLVDAQTLNKPEHYVESMRDNMMECRMQFGTATVQLGRTGKGHSPNYLVSPAPDPNEDVDTQRYAAFHGLNHKEMDIDASDLKHANWSSERSDFEEVEAILGELHRLLSER